MSNFSINNSSLNLNQWAHGSHGSHSSHSQHSVSNSDSHSNSISSGSITTAQANAHSATIGGVDWSGSFSKDGKMGNPSGTGSLSQLASIVNSMRSRVTSTTYADNTELNTAGNGGSIPSSNTKIDSSGIQNLVRYGGSSYKVRYQPFTLTMSVTADGASGTTGVSATKTQDISGNVNTGTTSWTTTSVGHYQGSTKSFTFTDSLSGQAIKAATSVPSSVPSYSRGTKITKAQATEILTALGNETLTSWKGPAAASFSWSGYNNMGHSQHNSHSSY